MTAGPENTAAERLVALGRLAGGVAHDFNNILTVVHGYAEILAQSVGDDPDARDAVEMILDAARRGGSVTRQLLQFSRREDADAGDIDVAETVRECAYALRRVPTVPAEISIDVDVEGAPAMARIDREAFIQALSLLVTHGATSLPDGGSVVVSVRSDARAGFVDAAGDSAPPGDYVQVSVADTGAGLNEDSRLRVFEPFFSPTGEGKGAGLVLAAAFGIVKGSGGFIEVASAPGRGTTFTLSLPLVADAMVAVTTSRPAFQRITVDTTG